MTNNTAALSALTWFYNYVNDSFESDNDADKFNAVEAYNTVRSALTASALHGGYVSSVSVREGAASSRERQYTLAKSVTTAPVPSGDFPVNGMAFRYIGEQFKDELSHQVHYFVGKDPTGSSWVFVSSLPGRCALHWHGFPQHYERWPERDLLRPVDQGAAKDDGGVLEKSIKEITEWIDGLPEPAYWEHAPKKMWRKRIEFLEKRVEELSTPPLDAKALGEDDHTIEVVARLLWQRDYPSGGALYKTYESTQFHDKELYRNEARELLGQKGGV